MDPELIRALRELAVMGGASDTELRDATVWNLQNLDRERGAPVGVRLAYGSARTPQDQLAAVQAQFPRAVRVNSNQIVYLDKDGIPVLYNEEPQKLRVDIPGNPLNEIQPEGRIPKPSIGDVAQAVPQIAEFLGGVGGAAAGLAVGGPGGAAVGGGLGATGAREATERTIRAAMDVPDSRSATQQAQSAALTTGINMIPDIAALGVRAGAQAGKSALLRGMSDEAAGRMLGETGESVRLGLLRASGADDETARAALQMIDEGGVVDDVLRISRQPVEAAPHVELAALRDSMDPDVWDAVASNTFGAMGGDTFNPVRFLNAYEKMPAATRDAIFGGTEYAAVQEPLQELLRVTSQIRGRGGNATSQVKRVLGTIGFGGIGTLAGGLTGGLAGGAVGAATDASRAALMRNPRFVKWLATSVPVLNRSPQALPSMMARLAAIAELEPEIASEINTIYLEPYQRELQGVHASPVRFQ